MAALPSLGSLASLALPSAGDLLSKAAHLVGIDGLVFSQASRLMKVESCFPDDTLLVDKLVGSEGVSTLYSFKLSLISHDADLELKQAMGQPISVSLQTASGEDRYFHGYVTQFAHTGSDGGWAFYECSMGSWLEFLRHRINCRVFQEKSVLEILRTVFREYGAVASFEVGARNENHKPITLVCQYNESDLAFVTRLMDEHGLYFYFRFEEDLHTLVIEEESILCPSMPMQDRIEFNVDSGATTSDTITQFGSARQLVSNRVAAKTSDFKNPGDPMLVMTQTNHEMGDLPPMEWYEYPGAYAYMDDRQGDRLVRHRIEEEELRSKSFSGASNVRSLTCGHSFILDGHYAFDGIVDDRTFFVLGVTHLVVNNYLSKSSGQTVYENHFTCVRQKIPYRVGRRIPKPVIPGMQTATVVGASNDEIHCDEYGRVYVRFPWDREGKSNAHSSCWVRVATQWAGNRFGFVSIPRVGTEVLIAFMEGDPDRPIVVGALYNRANMPPWKLPASKTQSGICSNSTPKGGLDNANILRFEDKMGAEELFLQAERNLRTVAKADEHHTVGHDRSVNIGNTETQCIKEYRTTTVGKDDNLSAKTITLNGTDRILLVCGGSTLELTPEGIALNGKRIDLNK